MKQNICSLLLFLMSIIFVVTLSFAALSVGQVITAFADLSDNYSDSIIDYENIEDCIEKDSVIITLTENETKKFKTYTADDFKEVGCMEIEDLTQFTTNAVKERSRGASTGESMLVETENYKKILKLTLNESGTDNVINAIETLNKRKDVLVAGSNYIYTIASTPDDAYWGMDGMWGLKGKGIQADSAWDITTGVSTVTVGVLDTGIEADHPDLVNRISTEGLHRDCTVNPIATVPNSNLKDPNGHGTHVAGIIGAQGNNLIGVSGVCWDVRLVSLKVSYEDGSGSTTHLARAIDYAASKNIPILNYSAGGYFDDMNVRTALENYKGLFVCSAGNGGEDNIGDDNDTNPFYPADYSYNQTFSDRVISVGAINSGGYRVKASNYGAKYVSIFAPGYNILSTYPTRLCATENYDKGVHLADGYHYKSGTSMAAPFVTGVAALLLSKNPNLTAAELKKVILSGADDINITVSNGSQNVKKLNAYEALKFDKITFDKQDGEWGTDYVFVKNGENMPAATAPAKDGYRFSGYYSKDGVMYYDSNMKSVRVWDMAEDKTLYADWSKIYTITFKMDGDTKGEYTFKEPVCYGDKWPTIDMPTRTGYYVGQYKHVASNRTYYYSFDKGLPQYDTFTLTEDIELVGTWVENTYNIVVSYIHWYADTGTRMDAYTARYNDTITLAADESMTIWVDSLSRNDTRGFSFWGVIRGGEAYYDSNTNPWRTISNNRSVKVNLAELVQQYYPDLQNNEIIEFRATYRETVSSGSCIAEGTLITLADGSQAPVESLTGNEMLLVWNMYTGTFDTAPILFIDSDPLGTYEVINLYFSDGTQVKAISEHGFWDFNLNRYVYLDENAAEYIGHWFNKQTTDENGEFLWTSVQLTDVVVQCEYTAAYSPVTYGHLCYYVDGMLSMPGGIEGLFNIFEVDSTTMSYDIESMQKDIEQYGLFTYEEFAEILPVPEEIFNAFSGQYLKVAMGKGLIDFERIAGLVERYQKFF